MSLAILVKGSKAASEYFCTNCKQLRLNLAGSKVCENCGSASIIEGKPRSLDKAALLKQWKGR